jgi:ornithine cyclodeaminase/alanine dehydrogenase-like protein (mu-crystallin family)
LQIRLIGADALRAALPMDQAIEAMKEAYRQLSSGQAVVPLRGRLSVDRVHGVTLLMPALLKESGDMAVKIVSVFPQNAERSIPTIHGLVVALDSASGRPTALLEGGALTALRTGAGSGAATDLLARTDAKTVAILGSGVQARTQLEAVCTIRAIKSVRVYSPHRVHADSFADAMAGVGPVPTDVQVSDSPRAAVEAADIICAATTSSTPVFPGSALRPGAHVNGVGSFTPDMQEVDLETLRRATVYVDSRQAALEEAGDLIGPIERGEFDPDAIFAEIGEVVSGSAPGRQDDEQITFFKSVGVAVQDAVAAGRAVDNAVAAGLGDTVEL